jgi:hypothetical protein
MYDNFTAMPGDAPQNALAARRCWLDSTHFRTLYGDADFLAEDP